MAKANRPETPFRGWWMQNKDGVGRRRALAALLRGRRRAFPEPPAAPAGGPDPSEVAREQEDERVWLAVLDRSPELRLQAEEALRRLAQGAYGLCMDCAKRIAAPRLRALPFALRCLRCQERCEAESDRTSRLGGPAGIRNSLAGQDGAGAPLALAGANTHRPGPLQRRRAQTGALSSRGAR
jgi:RNA polymerase-binding transcription factor DksA